MHHTLQKTSTFILIALLGIASFVAYNTFSSKALADNTDLSVSQDNLIDPEAAALLTEVESIKLDAGFFQNPAFLSLQNFTVPLTPELAGMSNPFAPLSGSGKTAR